MRSLLVALSFAAATCQRVDEPAPAPAPDVQATAMPERAPSGTSASPPAEAALTEREQATAPAATSEQDSGAGRCIQPLLEPPPPPAKASEYCPHDPGSAPTLAHGKVAAPEAPGAPVIDVEIADTPPAEQRGLMYRKKLGAERGMIFVWPTETIRTFWMHNTCLPLDMLFLAKDGTVVGLLEQVPPMNDAVRQVRCPAAYVLEVNAGWSRRHGVKPGMKLAVQL